MITHNHRQPNVQQTPAHEESPEFGRFLHLAVTTGARRGELCALKWSSIDTDAGTLTIGRAIVEIEGGLFEKDTKTHAIRRIALDEQTLAILADQHTAAKKLAIEAEVELPADAYVFTFDPAGAVPWTPDYATKTFQQIRTAAKQSTVRLHDLRHFAATRLLAAGVPVRTVSGRLGHANAATTLSVYAHFVEASDADAARILGAFLDSNPRGSGR